MVDTRKTFTDERGWLFEYFRQEQLPSVINQVTVFHCDSNTLRGMRVHIVRHEYVVVVQGSLRLGLYDLREGSPSFRACGTVELEAKVPKVVCLPAGVAHGMCFNSDGVYLNAFSPYWSGEDEMEIRYNDPSLTVDWGMSNPVVCAKDLAGYSVEEAIAEYNKRVKALS
ncbi:dTDP-4-dehydrorhamnose 3,5-epimerase family protein [Kordiimonas sp.]|uniref:dTDP-4-dehydrorhamnose 3,5-epimerase family protein n=1 Tax=Kordiimonas sp. TaxID=1970157 RepID=UPI003A926143